MSNRFIILLPTTMASLQFFRTLSVSHLLLVWNLFQSGISLTACAPPRFHVFSRQNIGSWNDATGKVQSVDEVMRSCGGAVQGVRDESSSLYLNRADDGFVFFDCGTYTHGPVTLSADSNNVCTTSFFLSPKSRILLSCKVNADTKGLKEPLIASRLRRASFGDDMTSVESKDFDVEVVDDMLSDVSWQRQTLCRMPTPSQPWMLQRVRWEQSGSDDNGWVEGDFVGSGTLQIWANVRISDEVQQSTDTLILTIGVKCVETGRLKEIVREYNSNGMLTRVALQTSMAPTSEATA